MAREVGPDQLILIHGEKALRQNDLAEGTSAFTIGARGNASSMNNSRLGMVLVARSDEETSISSRAMDISTEKSAFLKAQQCQRRAQVAFTSSLKEDHASRDSAIAYFGSAECMVEEAINLEKASMFDNVDRKKQIEKLRKHATKRYESAFMRNEHVNREYDRLLPLHLDVEGARTLESVHEKNIKSNQLASLQLVNESREKEAQGRPIGRDKWSDAVNPRAPAMATGGKYDQDGTRAEKELTHFRKAHERRLKNQFTGAELSKARNLISQGLNASRAKDSKVGNT
mmetsp:Transcript_38773/g.50175  ORF Transcript_38773/g.50175 Transcript_38773/m.50175 type:complete len:286 (-) Transcript_38773:92-949(-)